MFFEPLGLENKQKKKKFLTFLQFRAHFQKKNLETAEMLKNSIFKHFCSFEHIFKKKNARNCRNVKSVNSNVFYVKKMGSKLQKC